LESAGDKSVGISDDNFYIAKNPLLCMVTITPENCRALELKIQKEIQKIFSEFLQDLEKQGEKPTGAKPIRPERKTGPEQDQGPPKTGNMPGKRRGSKKFAGVMTLLRGPGQQDRKTSHAILEEDMGKIFRKKRRRGES
jgi:hypothetical protein